MRHSRRACRLLRWFGLASAILGLTAGYPVQAYQRTAKWSSVYAPDFPVVRAYTCPNLYNTYFTQPWVNIQRHVLASFNEWFASGGVHLRVRWQADLADTDVRCTEAGNPADGEILVSADKYDGGNRCHLATTYWWTNGDQLRSAKIVMHAGTTCSGSYQAYSWANNADYPGDGQYDFRHVLTHEVGHAIGFDHSADPRSLMYSTSFAGPNVQPRFLSTDDSLGLRDAVLGYEPAQTYIAHSDAAESGASWQVGGPYNPTAALGGVDVCARSHVPAGEPRYLVALTRPGDASIVTTLTDGTYTYGDAIQPFTSFKAPAVACSLQGYAALAYAATDLDSTLMVTTGGPSVWQPPTSTGLRTGVPPALAFDPWWYKFVLVFTDPATSQIRTMVSNDGGTTYTNYQEWNGFRAANSVSIACQDSASHCTIVWNDATVANTPVRSASFEFGPNWYLVMTSTSTLPYDSYGPGVAATAGRFEFVWRDRGRATVLTAGGWAAPPTLDTDGFTATKIHSPPRMTWSPDYSEWSTWYTWGVDYDR